MEKKEVWQMNREEWIEDRIKKLRRMAKKSFKEVPWSVEYLAPSNEADKLEKREPSWVKLELEEVRKKEIEKALREGKAVPPEVVRDYPDLAEKYPVNDTWKLNREEARNILKDTNMDLHKRAVREALEVGLEPYKGWEEDYPDLLKKYEKEGRRMDKKDVKEYYKEINKFLNTKYKEGLKEVLKSGRFQELLKVRNLSYAYSIYNTILIISQRPEILEKGGLVLPRYKWEKLGRKIKKGAEEIWIWRPNPKKIYDVEKEKIPAELRKYEEIARNAKDEKDFIRQFIDRNGNWKDEAGQIRKYYPEKEIGKSLKEAYEDLKRGYKERRIEKGEKMYFKPEKIYAQEDTYGRELPDLKFKTLKGNDYKRFYEMIRDSSPIPVQEIYSVRNLPYHGFYDPKSKSITIRRGKDYNAQLSTLIHELSHAIRDKEGLMRKDRNFEEAVVESTSIAILSRMGVKEAVQYRGEYVLSFLNAQSEEDLEKKSKELFKETDKTVRKVLEEVPAIQVAISEVDREFIDYEHQIMMENEKGKEESVGKEMEGENEMEMGS